ncbi:GNAT family N-acetyltransferase [Paractinoplanes maris]|uniref:GNAT family N-acetyltransferase n=1 Tax=Paractinoplanes maris TaxID=1734446 RepID=UPI0020214A72|nr:GNAT family protein [Actinoplanes maris]
MSADVHLRSVQPADVDVFFLQQQELEAQRRANFRARDRPAFTEHWTQRILGDPDVSARTVLAGGEIAGNVVSWWQGEHREVGYWLGQAFWGRGVGTRAVTLYLDVEPVRPLTATADVGNTASIRLLERCGFTAVETVRQADVAFVVLELRSAPAPTSAPTR